MGLLHRIWQQWQKESDVAQYEHLEGVVPHFIHGEHLTIQNGEAIPIFSPATGQAIRQVYPIDISQIDTVVATAVYAQAEWSLNAIEERIAILIRFRELLKTSSAEVIRIILQEQGYTEELAQAELTQAIHLLNDAPQWQERLAGHIGMRNSQGFENQIRYEALGVIVGVERSHMVLLSSIWLIMNALSCGNSLIIQPSIQHPSLVVMLADLLKRAGLPNGVLNILQGNDTTVRHLLMNSQISGVLFQVASMEEEVISYTYHHTNVAIIVDCHAGAIVNEGADLLKSADTIVSHFIQGCQNGQKVSAVMVMNSIADEFISILKKQISTQLSHTSNCYTGLPTIEAVQETFQRLEISRKNESSLELLTIKEQIKDNQNSWFTGLSLVDNVKPDSILLQPSNHILPILPIIRIPDIQVASAIVGGSKLLNSIGLFGENVSSMYMQSLNFSVHQLGMNTLLCRPCAYIGLSGVNTYDTLAFFTRSKTICTRYL